jgi:hypothetical protein
MRIVVENVNIENVWKKFPPNISHLSSNQAWIYHTERVSGILGLKVFKSVH